jgi:hypothetical protein
VPEDPRLATLLAWRSCCRNPVATSTYRADLTMYYLTGTAAQSLAGLEELMATPHGDQLFVCHRPHADNGFAECLKMMLMISRLDAVATAIVARLLIMKRRALARAWGYMRVGLLMFGRAWWYGAWAHHNGGERNWRPNLLVLAGHPTAAGI